ncbi:MAG: alpha/beta fold hydrolase [Verrucomicrobiales bacterium]|nr:alpha/beta fold hydrolase [Verrucomicrobiales bacterium]
MNRSIPSVLRNARGQRLDFAVHAGRADEARLMVLGHGVTGNKDRPLLVVLAEALAQAGITTLRLSFAGNGASEGAFADSTITSEVEDLGAVLDALPGWQVGYAGHSMGGAVGVLRAARDPRLRWLVSLAGMAHTAAFTQREFGTITPGAGLMWDKPECPLSQAYMDDLTRLHSVASAARAVRLPWLLVHGTEDDVVPIQDSRDLMVGAGPERKLIEIPGSDHVFSEAYASLMANAVVEWMATQRG